MYLADDHTHTRFSPDAHSSMTAMAQAAMAAGLDEICFTDHVEPLVWGSTELRKPYDWTLLTEDFRTAQRPWVTGSGCIWAWSWGTPSGRRSTSGCC